MPSPILARADALMHRKRLNDSEADEVPVLTDAIDDDDIPVLLDAENWPTFEQIASEEAALEEASLAVAEEFAEKFVAAPLEAPAPRLDPALRDQLVHELARRVEQRLSAELPRIIESTVLDFLAEQEMIAGQTACD